MSIEPTTPPPVGEISDGLFYQTRSADAIMCVANFPDEIVSFLHMEILSVHSALRRHGSRTLIELGCFDGRALEIAKRTNVHYVGVDVNEAALATLRTRIIEEDMRDRARVVHCDAGQWWQWSGHVQRKPTLCLLPFNFIGMHVAPESLLRKIALVGGIMAISAFDHGDYTTQLRRLYYSTCGVGDLRTSAGQFGGVVFQGDGEFFSQSFHPRALVELIADCGGTVLSTATSKVGTCLIVDLDRSPPGLVGRMNDA